MSYQRMEEEEDVIDIKEIVLWLRHRIWIILLAGLLAGTAMFTYSKILAHPVYSSTTKLHIVNKSGSLTSLSLSDLQLGTQLTQDYKVIIMSRPVIEKTISNLGLGMSYDQLKSSISVNNPTDTRIMEITVNYTDAYLAKQIVDELASVSAYRIAEIMDISEPRVIEEGFVSTWPISPNIKKNVLIGFLAGAFLAAAIIVVINLLNDRIKSAEDVEKALDLSMLGVLPVFKYEEKRKEVRKHHKRNSRNVIEEASA